MMWQIYQLGLHRLISPFFEAPVPIPVGFGPIPPNQHLFVAIAEFNREAQVVILNITENL
jgi:hypothetical protein